MVDCSQNNLQTLHPAESPVLMALIMSVAPEFDVLVAKEPKVTPDFPGLSPNTGR